MGLAITNPTQDEANDLIIFFGLRANFLFMNKYKVKNINGNIPTIFTPVAIPKRIIDLKYCSLSNNLIARAINNITKISGFGEVLK